MTKKELKNLVIVPFAGGALKGITSMVVANGLANALLKDLDLSSSKAKAAAFLPIVGAILAGTAVGSIVEEKFNMLFGEPEEDLIDEIREKEREIGHIYMMNELRKQKEELEA